MERAGRLVKILSLIKAYRSLTAEDLSDKLEVSVRTIYRDIDALNLWGIPIVATSGHGGGYSLPDKYSIDPDMFTSNQISVLSAGSTALKGLSDFLEDPKDIELANEKLLATMSDSEKQIVLRQIKFIHFDRSRWYKKYQYRDTLRVIKNSVLYNRIISIEYFERNDPKGQNLLFSIVESYGLVFKSDTWYLVGYCNLKKGIRRWNVTRILKVQNTNETFRRPANFSLSEWWEDELESFGKGKTRVLLKINKSALHRFDRVTWKNDNRFFDDGANLIVEMMVSGYQWIIDLVLVNRGDVVVLEPLELNEAVKEAANNILVNHNQKTPTKELNLVDFEIFSFKKNFD